jgi:hypothetical protein
MMPPKWDTQLLLESHHKEHKMKDVNTWKLNAQEIKHLDIQTTRLHERLIK